MPTVDPNLRFFKKAQQVSAMEYKAGKEQDMVAFCPYLSVREPDGALIFKGNTVIVVGWWVFVDDEGSWMYSNIFLDLYQKNP